MREIQWVLSSCIGFLDVAEHSKFFRKRSGIFVDFILVNFEKFCRILDSEIVFIDPRNVFLRMLAVRAKGCLHAAAIVV